MDLSALIKSIVQEAEEIEARRSNDDRTPLNSLFSQAIRQTMEEIKKGANSEQFEDIVVVNLLIAAALEKFSKDEIKEFVDRLSPDKEEPPSDTDPLF